jgi:SnoaL-like domain
MSEVIDRLVVAMNAHDLDAVAGLIHQDYRSEQPAHPGRAFAGRAQMLANWEAMFAGIPSFHAETRYRQSLTPASSHSWRAGRYCTVYAACCRPPRACPSWHPGMAAAAGCAA